MDDRELLMEFARWRHGSEVDWHIDVEVIDAFLAARQPPGYDPNFGDERECACGHPYRRHFDTYENMSPASCKYCGCEAWHEPSARQPPGEPEARACGCPTCQANQTFHVTTCARHGLSNCAECDGGSSPEMTTPPAPQRFWVVGPMLTNAGMWLCVTVDERGQLQTQYGPPRMTRAEAEADGIESKLPPWKP
jgi:hypothetical protein